MPFVPKIGDILYIYDGGGGHYYIVLTTANKENQVVIVNFTTADSYTDNTVVLNSVDCKLFDRPSAVFYKEAKLYPVKGLCNIVEQNANPYKGNYKNLIDEIVNGAFKSKHTINEIKEELRIYYPNEDR
jgi:hypothetical protein